MTTQTFTIRAIEPRDDPAIASVIRTVMPEFGASGPGFAIHDPEVDHMYETYSAARHAYFVLEQDGAVIGGGGIGPLAGADAAICELRKMYVLPDGRGLGQGQKLLERCLSAARQHEFHQCYLETLTGMDAAQALYRRNGFARITGPLGNTGHFGCNSFYILDL